ncbi:hypothetical protein Tco_0271989 [Tanacetum coccineum]
MDIAVVTLVEETYVPWNKVTGKGYPFEFKYSAFRHHKHNGYTNGSRHPIDLSNIRCSLNNVAACARLLLDMKMLERIFMNKICRMFLQFLLKYISDFVSALDLGIAVVMVGASIVIVDVGLGVVVEDLLFLESLIKESSVLMETGSWEFRVGWEYPAKN